MGQTSQVFNEVHWPGADPKPHDHQPDVDDCWVCSGIQLVNVTAPWLPLPSVPEFRLAAGDPDDGNNDGGNIKEIMDGIRGTFPSVADLCHPIRVGTWEEFTGKLHDRHPISVAIDSSKLPDRIQFGFKGFHQCTIYEKADGRLKFANPLSPVYSAWETVNLSEVRPAILGYGELKAGKPSVFGVWGPTDLQAIKIHPQFENACQVHGDDELDAKFKEGYNAALGDGAKATTEALLRLVKP